MMIAVPSSSYTFLLLITAAVFFFVVVSVDAWVSSSSRRSLMKMDVEAPPVGYTFPSSSSLSSSSTLQLDIPTGLQSRWNNYSSRQRRRNSDPQQKSRRVGITVDKTTPTKPLLDECHLPWSSKTNVQSSSTTGRFVYKSHWDLQMKYLHEHLTNLRVKRDDDSSSNKNNNNVDDLLHMISHDGNDRIYTVALESDEYRDIRMTYLDCDGGATQIFRCACYPRANGKGNKQEDANDDDPLPVLGMGFMQFAGGRRNVAIMDYQPLHHNNDESQSKRPADDIYQSQLNAIRSQYPDFQQSMSDKHFDADEKQLYWTDSPLISKWNDNGENNEWKQLESSHQRVLEAHVQLTKGLVAGRRDTNEDDSVKQLHAEYDRFLSAREPAGHLLTKAFGSDVSDRMVHQVLFPLSR